MVSPLMINNIKYGTYIVWACTNFAFIPLVYFFSKNLPRIAAPLTGPTNIRQFPRH